jgi:hypothetical protein
MTLLRRRHTAHQGASLRPTRRAHYHQVASTDMHEYPNACLMYTYDIAARRPHLWSRPCPDAAALPTPQLRTAQHCMPADAIDPSLRQLISTSPKQLGCWSVTHGTLLLNLSGQGSAHVADGRVGRGTAGYQVLSPHQRYKQTQPIQFTQPIRASPEHHKVHRTLCLCTKPICTFAYPGLKPTCC